MNFHREPAVYIGLAFALLEAFILGMNKGLSARDAALALVPLIVSFFIRGQVRPNRSRRAGRLWRSNHNDYPR